VDILKINIKKTHNNNNNFCFVSDDLIMKKKVLKTIGT